MLKCCSAKESLGPDTEILLGVCVHEHFQDRLYEIPSFHQIVIHRGKFTSKSSNYLSFSSVPPGNVNISVCQDLRMVTY